MTQQQEATPDHCTQVSGKIWTPAVSLLLILILATALRWPMIVRAERHMDSDLAVDGLTLRDLLEDGHWRWHYPGTPHIGTMPVLFSMPAAMFWGGDSPSSLVFAGLICNLLIVAGLFFLVREYCGGTSAIIACLILASGGLGQVWLSSRVTGGHLLAAAWSVWSWFFWTRIVKSQSTKQWFAFGFFCSLGLWNDSLFMLSLMGLGAASLIASWVLRKEVHIRRRLSQALAFLIILPFWPVLNRNLGDGYNAYGSQFEITTDPEVLRNHTRLLVLECLPRLLLGRTLKGGTTEIQLTHLKPADWLSSDQAGVVVWVLMAFFLMPILLRLKTAGNATHRNDQSSNAREIWMCVWLGHILTAVATIAAFRFNLHIYNADNYRYLVLLIPMAGMFFGVLAEIGPTMVLRRMILTCLACFLATDVFLWQRANGFRDTNPPPMEPGLQEMLQEGLLQSTFQADYWEVYRGLYLANRPISQGRPFGFFPDRFPKKSPKNPDQIVIGKSPTSLQMLQQARQQGASLKFRYRGFEVYQSDSSFSDSENSN